MVLLVNVMRGMKGRPCRAVLPSLHIGSTANEMTGPTVIRGPHRRKENQCVMNRRQSTSIPRNDHPENHKGEGSTPSARQHGSLACARNAYDYSNIRSI